MDPFSITGLLSMASGVASAVGQYQASKYQSFKAEQEAKIGAVKADQIDSAYREELSSTLSNIRNIRASTGVGANSPTTLALEDANTKQSDTNRTRDVANQRIQINQNLSDSKYLKRSAGLSLGIGIGSSLLKLQSS
jgi:valyl-tRNA synthetase